MQNKKFLKAIINMNSFIKFTFNDLDISQLNLDINKTQRSVLMCIFDNSDKTMNEISYLVGLEKSSFTRSVENLINIGYLNRNSDLNDRRKIYLALTEKGMEIAIAINEIADKHFGDMLLKLTDTEQNEFIAALETVSKYIKKF